MRSRIGRLRSPALPTVALVLGLVAAAAAGKNSAPPLQAGRFVYTVPNGYSPTGLDGEAIDEL